VDVYEVYDMVENNVFDLGDDMGEGMDDEDVEYSDQQRVWQTCSKLLVLQTILL
jgi:hypothetical protein